MIQPEFRKSRHTWKVAICCNCGLYAATNFARYRPRLIGSQVWRTASACWSKCRRALFWLFRRSFKRIVRWEISVPKMPKESRIRGLPDVLAKGLDVVFCGINPGMRSARLGYHFANPNNRFWRVVCLSGFTPEQISPQDARSMLNHRCGLTSAVEKPTVGARDLTRSDFIAARPELERKIARYAPRYLAFLGKPACAAILNRRDLAWGLQEMQFGGADVWVLPNPSGLNCAFTLTMLVSAYGELFEAVGSSKRTATPDAISSRPVLSELGNPIGLPIPR